MKCYDFVTWAIKIDIPAYNGIYWLDASDFKRPHIFVQEGITLFPYLLANLYTRSLKWWKLRTMKYNYNFVHRGLGVLFEYIPTHSFKYVSPNFKAKWLLKIHEHKSVGRFTLTQIFDL